MNRFAGFTLLMLFIFSVETLAQAPWVIEVSIDVNHNDCAQENITSASLSFKGVAIPGDLISGYTFYGSNPPSGIFTASGSATCAESYDRDKPITGTFSDSYSTTYSFGSCYEERNYISYQDPNDPVYISGIVRFFPKLTLSVAQDCLNPVLTSTNCAGNNYYNWEVSNASNGTYYPFGSTISNSIVANADLLHRNEFGNNKYQARWVRVTGRPGTMSDPVQVDLWPPAYPIVSVSSVAPLCPDGSGSFSITHDPTTPLGTVITYSLIEYLPQPSPCLNGGSTLSIVNYDATYPAGLSTGGKTYCEGSKQTFQRTITTAADRTQILSAQNLPGNLKFKSGIYRLVVETGSASCFKTYYIEIPPAVVNFSISETSGANKPPSCLGGNDGATAIAISGGVPGYTWSVSNQSSQVVADGSMSGGSIPVKNLSSGIYTAAVKDACLISRSVTVTIASSPTAFTASTVLSNPLCVFSNTGNGSITVNSIPISGVSYNYYLTSGASPVASELGTTSLSKSFGGLASGSYDMLVQTSNGCSYSKQAILLSPPSTLNIAASKMDVTCSNGSDGEIKLTNISKSYGSVNYSYTLSRLGGGLADISANGITDAPGHTISSSLPDGTYSLSVVDNCLNNAAINLGNLTITKPTELSVDNLSDTYIPCADGMANANNFTFHDGTAPFTLNLSLNGSSVSGFPKANYATRQISVGNLTVGTYNFSVTDACGVTKQISFSVLCNANSISGSIYVQNLPNNYNLPCSESTNGVMKITLSGGVQGTTAKYKVDLLDQNGNQITSNVNPPVVNEKIQNETVAGQSVTYDITGLMAGVAYKIRVTDSNTNPGPCTKIFDNINGQPLTLTAPPPLVISTPNLNTDFQNAVVYNSELYAQCKGDLLGYTANITGGNSPYVVTLNKNTTNNWPGSAFQTVTASSPAMQFFNAGVGYYQVVVQDANSCASVPRYFQIKEATANIDVTQISAAVFPHGANTSCYGSSDGAITISGTGGVGPYSYALQNDNGTPALLVPNNPLSTHAFTALPALKLDKTPINYTIVFSDVLGCKWQPNGGLTDKIVLLSPQPVTFTHKVISRTAGTYEIPCRGEEASLTFKSAGGLFPHVISVKNQVNLIFGPKQQNTALDSLLFNLPTNSYNTNVVDALGCTASPQNFVLDEPATKILLALNSVTPPVCIGGSDGSIKLSANGGIQGNTGTEYTFSIRPVGSTSFDPDSLSALSASFLRPANGFTSKDYVARVRDANLCTSDVTFTMPVNPSPLTLAKNDLISPSCYGAANGSIKVTASNYSLIGGAHLKFKISGGHLENAVQTIDAPSNSYTFTNLQGTDLNGFGPYRIWVEDAHICVDTAFQFLPVLSLPSFEPINVFSPNLPVRPSCINAIDGSLSLRVSGGVMPYFYSRDGINYQQMPATSIGVPNLAAGSYSIYIRDANYDPLQPACQKYETFQVPIGRKMVVSASVTPISCKNGDDGGIDVQLDLTNRNVGELFDPARLTTFWTHDNLSTSNPVSTNEDVNGLTRGTYSIHLAYDLDSATCTSTKAITVTEPYSIFKILDVISYDAPCGLQTGGKAIVTVEGGWSGSVNYYRLDSGVWTAFYSSTFLLQNLAVGNHYIEVAQQQQQCIDGRQFSINSASLALSLSTIIPPSCPFNSDATVVLASDKSIAVFSLDGIEFQTSAIFSSLASGDYNFTAREINNSSCTSKPLNVTVADPLDCGKGPLTASILSNVSSTCAEVADGRVEILASGGVPPYSYALDNSSPVSTSMFSNLSLGDHSVVVSDLLNNTFSIKFHTDTLTRLSIKSVMTLASCPDSNDGKVSVIVSGGSGNYSIIWSNGATTFSIESLTVGSYDYKVSDDRNSNCVAGEPVPVQSVKPLIITPDLVLPPTCPEGNDGKISISVSGGSGMYQYAWSNGDNLSGITGLHSGNYIVSVTDQLLKCIVSQSIDLQDPLPIQVSQEINLPRCVGADDGKISLTISNSFAPLIQWSNGVVGATIDHISSGSYSYSITGQNGCSITGNVLLPDPEALAVMANSISPKCFSSCDGEINLSIQGGISPYFVSWSNGAFGLSAKGLCSGNYSYSVYDRRGCTFTGSREIESPSPVTLSGTVMQPTCQGADNGSIATIVSGGTGIFSYLWENGNTSATLSSIPRGRYSVRVSDSNNCMAAGSFMVDEPSLLQITDHGIVNPLCNNSSDGKISLNAQGGTSPYVFQWDDGWKGAVRTNIAAGIYRVKVTDARGCLQLREIALQNPTPLSIINAQQTNPKCHDDANGSISLSVVGGAAPYQYTWENQFQSPSIGNLKSGTYNLIITDKNRCKLGASFVLRNPVITPIDGVPREAFMCSGGKIIASPTGTWDSYNWEGPDGFTSFERQVEARVAGEYLLTATDLRGCPSEARMAIIVSDDLLRADFLRISEAIEDEPIVFVDISVPIPEHVEWITPTGSGISILSTENNMTELMFEEPGEYLIGMRATKETCESVQQKIVKVERRDEKDTSGDGRKSGDSRIEVRVFPNPVNEEVFIELSTPDVDPINIRLISNVDQREYRSETLSGKKEYFVRWYVPEAKAGVYTLLLNSGGKSISRRLIIIR